MSATRADVVEEARRIAEAATEEGLALRLLGGVAIRVRAKDGLAPVFEREYADHDWISSKGASANAQKFFQKQGYTPHTSFNALNGRERLLFFDESHNRQVDVFVGSFRMSHEIPFGKRLASEPLTIPLAELLLTKLQIVELNEKDVKDALTLFHGYPVGEGDDSAINRARIASLCASDWGLWRTLTTNLDTCLRRLDGYDLPVEDKARMAERLEQLADAIEREPKSRKWRLRARIGERKRWYELPEEVTGDPE